MELLPSARPGEFFGGAIFLQKEELYLPHLQALNRRGC